MVKIYRISDGNTKSRAGYTASYVADIEFRQDINTAGVIVVTIPNGQTKPHVHNKLEELFIAGTDIEIQVNGTRYQLHKGDTVLVEPGEYHNFKTCEGKTGFLIAIKFPNLTNDKES
jgi:quercetin dioxygenase-like cupin family protein